MELNKGTFRIGTTKNTIKYQILLHREGVGSVLAGCCLPLGCKDIAQLLPPLLGTAMGPPLFSRCISGTSCPYRSWTVPRHAMYGVGRSHTPLRPRPTRTWCTWPGARRGGCASAGSCSLSPGGHCQGHGRGEARSHGCCEELAVFREPTASLENFSRQRGSFKSS